MAARSVLLEPAAWEESAAAFPATEAFLVETVAQAARKAALRSPNMQATSALAC